MSTVADILKIKGYKVYSIDKSATVYEAVAKMTEKSVGCLVVTKGEETIGIVTERDYLRKVIIKGHTAKATPVTDIMTSEIICVGPESTVEQCMAIMTEKRIRHLPVIEQRRLHGLVSVGDLIKQFSRDQKVTIKYLTDYITDRYPA